MDPKCRLCSNYHVEYIDEYVGWVCNGSYQACYLYHDDETDDFDEDDENVQ